MEKEERNIPSRILTAPVEAEFSLQWGSRKRMRCVRVRGNNFAEVSSSSDLSSSSRIRRRITSRFLTLPHKEASFPPPTSHHIRNSERATVRSEIRKSWSCSPEKEEKYNSTRGGGSIVVGLEANEKITVEGKRQGGDDHQIKNKKVVWPKLCIGLSSKEKEEDFMAMKGCKLPQRPKKRAKIVQRTLLLGSPGAWLTDMCWERYQVREKKKKTTSTKKKGGGGRGGGGGGLKGMGSSTMYSDSE